MDLPANGFRFLQENETLLIEDFFKTGAYKKEEKLPSIFGGKKGAFLKVKLSYPPDLHKSHDDMPLAPERRKIDPSFFSKKQRQFLEKSHFNSKKLITTLLCKDEYLVHHVNLRFAFFIIIFTFLLFLRLYLNLGLKLEKVEKVLIFDESDYMSGWIDKCTQGIFPHHKNL